MKVNQVSLRRAVAGVGLLIIGQFGYGGELRAGESTTTSRHSEFNEKIDPRLYSVMEKGASAAEGGSRRAFGVRADEHGRVQVYVRTKAMETGLIKDIKASGGRIERVLPAYHLMQVSLPPEAIARIADRDSVAFISRPSYARVRAGSEMTEGDAVMQSDTVRSSLGFTGAGVRVGVISDGVSGLPQSVTDGDIPTGSDTSCDPLGIRTSGVICKSFSSDGIAPALSSEGTAMLEIVHDIAPDATLVFSNVATSADFICALEWMKTPTTSTVSNTNCSTINGQAGGGVDILVDDLGFYGEPFFEDGDLTLASQAVVDAGVTFVSAAGNDGGAHVQDTFNDSDGSGFHNFSSNGGKDFAAFSIPASTEILIEMQWNDSFSRATHNLDLILEVYSDSAHTSLVSRVTEETNNVGSTPVEEISYENTSQATQYALLYVRETDGSCATFEMFVLGISPYTVDAAEAGDSIFEHPAAAGVIAVGAVDQATPTVIETFSSQGPVTISGVERNKPEVVGPDGVTVTGNGGFGSPFYGTSAAAPHVAACLALVLEAAPTLTTSQVRSAVMSSTVDLGASGFDFIYGYGLVDCNAAVLEAQDLIAGRAQERMEEKEIKVAASPRASTCSSGTTNGTDGASSSSGGGCSLVQGKSVVPWMVMMPLVVLAVLYRIVRYRLRMKVKGDRYEPYLF